VRGSVEFFWIVPQTDKPAVSWNSPCFSTFKIPSSTAKTLSLVVFFASPRTVTAQGLDIFWTVKVLASITFETVKVPLYVSGFIFSICTVFPA
jgi:hypothetical protein